MITDVCVPISRLPDILLETRKDIDAAGITGLKKNINLNRYSVIEITL